MFGIFKKRKSQEDQAWENIGTALERMGASILLITQSGEIVMASEALKSKPRGWLGGQVVEVMIRHPTLAPYFIYYENEDYYFAMAGGQQSLSNFSDSGEYRSNVAQMLCMYLVLHLLKAKGKDIRHPEMSFSHNRIHTNVVAYVERHNNWYPIQQNAEEPEDATEIKVAGVNRGVIEITDVIAISAPSPS